MLMSVAFRAVVCALAAALSTCHAPTGNTTPTPVARAEAPQAEETSPAPRTFDPDVTRPDRQSAVGRVRAAIDRGEYAQAEAIATQALAHGREDELHRLWWLSARASRLGGHPARAFATLASVASSDHPLARWARLERAAILMEADPSAAAEEVAPLIEEEWAGQREARDRYAAALVAAGRADEAEPLLRALLAEASEDAARASVAMPLADLLAAKDDVDAKVEAVGLYRRVAMHAPLSSAGRDAEARAAALLASLPADRRRALIRPTPEEALARAEALAAAMQHAEAEEAFGDVAAQTEDEALQCRARYGQGRAVYYRRERRRAAELLEDVARDCEMVEVRAWARYLAGKGYSSAGENALALGQYARLEEEVPQHSLADDARYRSALIAIEEGDEQAAVDRLSTLPEAYPAGDMRGRARFMLAWRARASGDLETALSHLEASLAEGPQEDREDLSGRAAYWRATVLHELGRADEARNGWTAVVEERPLSYYAQQALVRLAETSPAAAESARATLGRRGDGAIRFAWREEFDTPAFARALELIAVGAVDEAQRELRFLRAGTDDDELRWVEAALMDRAGAHAEAVYLTRRFLHGFMERPPADEHYARWRIAYPRAYASAIEAAAAERPVPAELVFAIAREESSFRPDAVSVAHAYGLTQIILPTARRFGRRIDVTATRATLTDPAINVAIGAEYMGWLWERYEGNPAVLPSAYNAGQGATDRWIRERPHQRLDEWIEDIPYDETRRYTRRVLQTWGIYAWLDRGELPPLRAALPTR